MTQIIRKDKKRIAGEFMDSKTSGKGSSKSEKMPKQLSESVVKPFPNRKVNQRS